ncbi:MAG: alpha/beta hydrolase [Pseudomonadota bacterium]
MSFKSTTRYLIVISIGLAVASLSACRVSTSDDPGPITLEFEPGTTVDFSFESSGKRLSGIFDVPADQPAEALIIVVHSYGETNVRNWISYSDERRRFNDMRIATALWDKPGLGRSEGTFDIDQPVHESAQEVLDAVAYLREIGAPGAQKIGLWGGSRAGWIAPIALSQDPDLDFWVSVSGTSAEDNFSYLLLSNLPYEGVTHEEALELADEWRAGCEVFRTRGSFGAYQKATQKLRANEYIISMRGAWPNRLQYKFNQRSCEDGKCPNVDNELCDYVWIENFDHMLSSLNIDVLALFGEKDLNVNWRKTRDLYTSTMGVNPDASLVVRSFPDADHALNIAQTGSMKEMQAMSTRTKTEGYFEEQTRWLQERVLKIPETE